MIDVRWDIEPYDSIAGAMLLGLCLELKMAGLCRRNVCGECDRPDYDREDDQQTAKQTCHCSPPQDCAPAPFGVDAILASVPDCSRADAALAFRASQAQMYRAASFLGRRRCGDSVASPGQLRGRGYVLRHAVHRAAAMILPRRG